MTYIKRDYLNRELKIGDDVVFIEPGYREYNTGKIIQETNLYFRVAYNFQDKYKPPSILQAPKQLIKI
jgi:hypothetical protein